MRTLSLAMLGAALGSLAACHGHDLGSGVNTVDREFSRPVSETWTASVRTAEAADLKVWSDLHDRLGGELVAVRANGNEVRIRVASIDERSSRVSVRVEPGDRDLALMLQERIADRVGLGEAKSGLFGGHSIEATYAADLQGCGTSARRTFAVLRVTAIRDEVHAAWSQIDGRLRDSTPVRIRMEKEDDLKTRVIFIAGNEKTDDTQAFVRRMKGEFDATTRLEGSEE